MVCKEPVKTQVQQNATNILPGADGVPRFPDLDPKLRDLFVQALRADRDRWPNSVEMLVATRNEGGQVPVDDVKDSDADMIQRLMYNA
ncbi:hypothetical protein FHL15_010290 [Xylaria flabelliformis]|uniref:Uncharacterized protein n=1 Tax=Xylaria flabelliformis TaxID=2512241 RepID=A0A553HLJ4_9PEZI|nr:hypothetical protein FHL15_010290 [Xylaria flabelliformis]